MTVVDPIAPADGGALRQGTGELAGTALTLARRFADGATMWCVAPSAGHHARHVAVEFVHPVIVGKRSLPAVAIDDATDLVAAARLLVRPGDLVCAIGDVGDPVLAALLRRGEAWGVRTVLLAVGARPDTASADHVIWVGPADDGGALLAYHLLWELTQVVLEHPGLLAEPVEACADDACITCSDEGRVVEVRAMVDDHTAEVLAAGHVERIDTTVVDTPVAGDLLLVHAGLALSVIGEER